MNTRDLAETKAAELLRSLHITITKDRLTIATSAFLEGWVHGLRDAQRVQREVAIAPISDAQTDDRIRAGFGELHRMLSSK